MSHQPWICPKCGRVYSPSWPECGVCNAQIADKQTNALDRCLACGGYHGVGVQCPKYIVTAMHKAEDVARAAIAKAKA